MREKVVSISGGQTSAYIAACYESDALVFALVRTSDQNCLFKDRGLAKKVEDRIGTDFIGTLEDDIIINTIFDLEQYLGKKIDIVSGPTFDEVIKSGGVMPSWARRYCTSDMKVKPIFNWWAKKFDLNPVDMAIGFRANEVRRAKSMLKKLGENGLESNRAAFGPIYNKGVHKGKRKIIDVPWRRPYFPLIDDNIYKDDIVDFWDGKKVRFAKRNNCVGCFHRSASLLKLMSEQYPAKYDFFVKAEALGKGTFKENIRYKDILSMNFTGSLFDEENGCTSGYCGI